MIGIPPVIGVAGLGFLGRGVTACFLAHGYRVVAQSLCRDETASAESYIEEAINDLASHGAAPPTAASWRDRFVAVSDFASFRDAAFVVESVVEDLAVKQQVFDGIEAVISPETPLTTNTSSLPISELARGRRHPARFLGVHWAEPAYATRFLEVVRTPLTSDAALERTLGIARSVNKEPSVVHRDLPGLIVNRIGYAMFREALHLVEEGVADIETIDRSFRNAVGLWATFAGPFRWIDLTGGPALYGRTMANVMPTLSNAAQTSGLMNDLMAADARGVANGRGFYEYTPDDVAVWEERFRKSVWRLNESQNCDAEQEATSR